LGGIYTGLKTISHDKAFCVACDMPFLHVGLIRRLLDAAQEDKDSCVMPYSSKGIEPLHAVYAKAVIKDIETLLEKCEFQIRKVIGDHNCTYLQSQKEEECSFFNINTKQDLQKIVINGNRHCTNK